MGGNTENFIEGLKKIEETVFKEIRKFSNKFNAEGVEEVSLIKSGLAANTLAGLTLSLQICNLSFDKKIKEEEYPEHLKKYWNYTIEKTLQNCKSVLDKNKEGE